MSRPLSLRAGFTLIELMVVMVVIAILLSLLLVGVQSVRAAARNTSCKNNLRQMALAVNNFETSRGVFPPSWAPTRAAADGSINGWSTQALLLPYLEQQILQSEIDFSIPYTQSPPVVTADGNSQILASMRIPTYLCPSEKRDEVRTNAAGEPIHYPLNYGVNEGIWFVWNPVNGKGGPGAFYPNSRLQSGAFRDGMSFTLALAEVRAYQPYYRNAAAAATGLDVPPTTPAALQSLGGDFKSESGHTEWVDGRVHQIGFTTLFLPNAQILGTEGGREYDFDWTNQQEGRSPTVPTYAAVTARSYHSGGVNVAMMDGSVRTVDERIHIGVWQALSTRAGEEILPDTWAR